MASSDAPVKVEMAERVTAEAVVVNPSEAATPVQIGETIDDFFGPMEEISVQQTMRGCLQVPQQTHVQTCSPWVRMLTSFRSLDLPTPRNCAAARRSRSTGFTLALWRTATGATPRCLRSGTSSRSLTAACASASRTSAPSTCRLPWASLSRRRAKKQCTGPPSSTLRSLSASRSAPPRLWATYNSLAFQSLSSPSTSRAASASP